MNKVKEYLDKRKLICDCFSEIQCNGCALKGFKCGTDTDGAFEKVYDIVMNFKKVKDGGLCFKCGRDNKLQVLKEKIKFCPDCGHKIYIKDLGED